MGKMSGKDDDGAGNLPELVQILEIEDGPGGLTTLTKLVELSGPGDTEKPIHAVMGSPDLALLPVLKKIISLDHEGERYMALEILKNIACNAQNRLLICDRKLGIMQNIVDVIRNDPAEKNREMALWVAARLTITEYNKVLLVEDESLHFLSTLVSVIKDGENKLRVKALAIVSHLASTEESHWALLEHESLDLLPLLVSVVREDKGDARVEALTALLMLITDDEDEDGQSQIVQVAKTLDLLPLLVKVIRDDRGDARSKALYGLCFLLAHSTDCQTVSTRDESIALLPLLASVAHDDQGLNRSEALTAIWALMLQKDVQVSVVGDENADLLSSLVTVVREDKGPSRVTALRILGNIADVVKNKIPMGQDEELGLMPLLVSVIREDTGEARTEALEVLCSLADAKINQYSLAQNKEMDLMTLMVAVARESLGESRNKALFVIDKVEPDKLKSLLLWILSFMTIPSLFDCIRRNNHRVIISTRDAVWFEWEVLRDLFVVSHKKEYQNAIVFYGNFQGSGSGKEKKKGDDARKKTLGGPDFAEAVKQLEGRFKSSSIHGELSYVIMRSEYQPPDPEPEPAPAPEAGTNPAAGTSEEKKAVEGSDDSRKEDEDHIKKTPRDEKGSEIIPTHAVIAFPKRWESAVENNHKRGPHGLIPNMLAAAVIAGPFAVMNHWKQPGERIEMTYDTIITVELMTILVFEILERIAPKSWLPVPDWPNLLSTMVMVKVFLSISSGYQRGWSYCYSAIAVVAVSYLSTFAESAYGKMKGVIMSAQTTPSLIIPQFGARSTYSNMPRNRNDMFDISISGVVTSLGVSALMLFYGLHVTVNAPLSVKKMYPTVPRSLLEVNSVVLQVLSSFAPDLLNEFYDPRARARARAASIDSAVHLHWAAIAGVVCLIASVLQLIPLDNSTGSKLVAAFGGQAVYSVLGILSYLRFALLIPILIKMKPTYAISYVALILTKWMLGSYGFHELFIGNFRWVKRAVWFNAAALGVGLLLSAEGMVSHSGYITLSSLVIDYLCMSGIARERDDQVARDSVTCLSFGRRVIFFCFVVLLLLSLLPSRDILSALTSLISTLVGSVEFLKELQASGAALGLWNP